MSAKNGCGKVIDVTSNLGGFIPKKRRKRYKKGEGEKGLPFVRIVNLNKHSILTPI